MSRDPEKGHRQTDTVDETVSLLQDAVVIGLRAARDFEELEQLRRGETEPADQASYQRGERQAREPVALEIHPQPDNHSEAARPVVSPWRSHAPAEQVHQHQKT